jgi:hypothetical protein
MAEGQLGELGESVQKGQGIRLPAALVPADNSFRAAADRVPTWYQVPASRRWPERQTNRQSEGRHYPWHCVPDNCQRAPCNSDEQTDR